MVEMENEVIEKFNWFHFSGGKTSQLKAHSFAKMGFFFLLLLFSVMIFAT